MHLYAQSNSVHNSGTWQHTAVKLRKTADPPFNWCLHYIHSEILTSVNSLLILSQFSTPATVISGHLTLHGHQLVADSSNLSFIRCRQVKTGVGAFCAPTVGCPVLSGDRTGAAHAQKAVSGIVGCFVLGRNAGSILSFKGQAAVLSRRRRGDIEGLLPRMGRSTTTPRAWAYINRTVTSPGCGGLCR